MALRINKASVYSSSIQGASADNPLQGSVTVVLVGSDGQTVQWTSKGMEAFQAIDPTKTYQVIIKEESNES